MRRNIMKQKWSLLLVLLTAMFQLTVTSCSDDDSNGGGQPVITAVRVPDPAKADSTFTKAGPGSVIAIIGQNLSNALNVYINGQDVYFNSTMNTDHSIIVQIPSEADGFKLSAFDSEIPDEIRVVTTHGEAVYSFKITAPGPALQRIQASYPRETADTLRLHGLNLVDIEKIYITDLQSAQLDTTVWKEVGGNHVDITDYFDITQDHHLNTTTKSYETTSIVGALVPANAPDSGTVVIECAAGTTYIGYYKVPGKPVIKSLSSDFPVLGETITITGNEFVQVQSVTVGDVTYTPDEFTVAESEDAIEIVVTKIPTKGSGSTLSVTTPGGTASVGNVFEYSTLLNDFDSGITDEGWGPNAEYGTYGVGGTGNVGHFNSYGQWWGQMIFFKKDWSGDALDLPSYDVIPADASADDLYFAFEVYDNNSDYNNGGEGFQGYLRYEFWFGNNIVEGNTPNVVYDNFQWTDYDAGTFENPDGPVLQDIDGVAHTGKWYRHAQKLSYMDGFRGLTYRDIYQNGLGIVRIMSFTQGAKSGKVDVYIDNIRLIYLPKK